MFSTAYFKIVSRLPSVLSRLLFPLCVTRFDKYLTFHIDVRIFRLFHTPAHSTSLVCTFFLALVTTKVYYNRYICCTLFSIKEYVNKNMPKQNEYSIYL